MPRPKKRRIFLEAPKLKSEKNSKRENKFVNEIPLWNEVSIEN